MCPVSAHGYAGKLLRVDLTKGSVAIETLSEDLLRQCIGGTCLGAKLLYEEVPPRIEWSDPANRLFLASGPLGATAIGGTGTFSVVTKGALTNGATSSQANGFLGAYLRLAGFDGVVFQGAAARPQYIYIHDGTAELRDASHLVGKDTWETEDAVRQELGTGRSVSVYSIGPAGENLVRFAALVGDEGHVAAHNGIGAVMGSKKLKAVAVERGRTAIALRDGDLLKRLGKEVLEMAKKVTDDFDVYRWGTSRLYSSGALRGSLPVKNYTTSIFPEHARFMGDYVRTHFQIKRKPCWACQMHHCHIMTVTEGPYTGYVGEEPEYEQWAAWGSVIGQTDPGAAVVLSNEVDRLGMDTNEAGWVIAWVMECYERGLLTRKDTDGLEMTWGNVEATRAMLHKIARRQGFGSVLAEGVMRAARQVGGETVNCAIHTLKGNTPRGHDHRANWNEFFDTCVSNTGTIETITRVARPGDLGIQPSFNRFSPEDIVLAEANSKGSMQFEDSLGICRFIARTDIAFLCQAVNAATGWGLSLEEAMITGKRAVNLMRMFNLRAGIPAGLDFPSPRYGSQPVDGPMAGKSIMPHFRDMLHSYYKMMGWDHNTGVPLPQTLEKLGLSHTVPDLRQID